MIKALVGFFLGLSIAGAFAQIVSSNVMCTTAPTVTMMISTGSGTGMTVYLPSAIKTPQLQEPELYQSPWSGAWPSERR